MGNSAPQIDPKELAKQNKRMISKSIRTVEREQKKLIGQEAKLLKEIKALAQKNQHGPAKLLSKDLVRQRAQVNSYYTMISQLKAIEMRLATAQISQSMIDALKGANKVMTSVNENMDISAIRDVLREFSKQSEKMEMQSEMMNDQMDMIMDTGDLQEQSEEVYAQILGEIGMNLEQDMAAGKGQIKTEAQGEQNLANNQDMDLQARLDALKQL